MKKDRKAQTKRLLDLLNATADDPVPASLREAAHLSQQPQERQRKECPVTGKHCFSSEGQAKNAMRYRMRRGANANKLRAYHCEHCHQWHMTSSFWK